MRTQPELEEVGFQDAEEMEEVVVNPSFAMQSGGPVVMEVERPRPTSNQEPPDCFLPSLPVYGATSCPLEHLSEDNSEIVFQFVISTSNAEAHRKHIHPCSGRDLTSQLEISSVESIQRHQTALIHSHDVAYVPVWHVGRSSIPQSASPEEQHSLPSKHCYEAIATQAP